MDFLSLRSKHPSLTFERFDVKSIRGKTQIEYVYKLEPDIVFSPRIVFPFNIDKSAHSLLFNIGIVELLSYWKCACPRTIRINAGFLDSRQIVFFDKLLHKGLGEFFYTNGIDATAADFVDWKIGRRVQKNHFSPSSISRHGQIVMVGGGKDSSVALEILGAKGTTAVILNSTPASENIVKSSSINKVIRIERFLDPQLFKLNKNGYLNGHTPFSALLAFIGLVVAYKNGAKYMVVANEQSANEGNVNYNGNSVNHQYSKSFVFEKDFREYIQYYLPGSAEYFSILRPLNELQVMKMFSSMSKYHRLFVSCNRGKGEKWCGNCAKCAFVFLMLSAFLPYAEAVSIVGEDLFYKNELNAVFLALIGEGEHKPFECVGTESESRRAVVLAYNKLKFENVPVPPTLLILFQSLNSEERNLRKIEHGIETELNPDHFVPLLWEDKIKKLIKSKQ